MTMQKIGYGGTYLMELANTGGTRRPSSRRRAARGSASNAHWQHCMIALTSNTSREHEGQTVTLQGWLHNRRSSGKIHFLTVRDGSGFIQCVMSKQAVGEEAFRRPITCPGKRGHRARHGPRRRARAGRLRDRRHGARDRRRVARLPDHAEGARRRLPDGSPASVDPRAAAAGDPPRASRSHQRGPRLLQLARLHPRRHADLHAGGVRGHDDAVPGPVLRRRDGVSDAERPALQRSQRDGARQGLLLRPDVPRREVQDPPAPHRVLDGRARSGLRQPGRRDGSGRSAGRLGGRARPRDAGKRS